MLNNFELLFQICSKGNQEIFENRIVFINVVLALCCSYLLVIISNVILVYQMYLYLHNIQCFVCSNIARDFFFTWSFVDFFFFCHLSPTLFCCFCFPHCTTDFLLPPPPPPPKKKKKKKNLDTTLICNLCTLSNPNPWFENYTHTHHFFPFSLCICSPFCRLAGLLH